MADPLQELLETCSASGTDVNRQLRMIRQAAEAGEWRQLRAELVPVAGFMLAETTICRSDNRDALIGFVESLGRAAEQQNVDEIDRVLRSLEQRFEGLNTSF